MSRIDLSGLGEGPAVDTATEPRRIFSALPTRNQKYGYPRDVQTEVWQRWHERRTERDLVIKMNTGGGKTVVGLLILKSCLNERVGPAVYISPDKFLADQVRTQAAELGLEVTDDPNSARFRSGRSILVTHVHRLVNGLSVFGVQGANRAVIEIGTLLIDDAHACLETIEEQFTLSIPSDHMAYQRLLELFRDDLERQTGPGYRDLVDGDRSAAIPVPYWAWIDRAQQVLDLLHPFRNDDPFRFSWPLLAESLPLCRAAVSADEFQAKPRCIPIEQITAIERARRRLYLTATLADDSVLVTHFGAAPPSIASQITPNTADDMGDRMILMPQLTHPSADEGAIRRLIAGMAKDNNVVVIVPSGRRAEVWKPLAAAVHDRESIHQGVEDLRAGRVGLVVLINKYDGIDLPHDACRVLVLDGLPEAYGPIDRTEELALEDTRAFMGRQVQRIEQGMGRGVRSNDDYCVVFLLGAQLTDRIWRAAGRDAFSPATQKQLELSSRLADRVREPEQPLRSLGDIAQQCLSRDPGWVEASKSVLSGIGYAPGHIRPEAIAERDAFQHGQLGQWRQSVQALEHAADTSGQTVLRGWLKQEAASYLHHVDPVAAQTLQHSAVRDNRGLLKPRSGTEYVRLSEVTDQAARCVGYLTARYKSGQDLVLGVSSILADLSPDPDPAAVKRFEEALHQLGLHLGFDSDRPERETGDGPDVLWSVGRLEFFVIECKSGVTTETISRRDAEQLSHSMDWFSDKYDETCQRTPVLVHRSNLQATGVHLRSGCRILTFARLKDLRNAVESLGTSLAGGYTDVDAVRARLIEARLNGGAFLQNWTSSGRAQR